MRKLLTEADGRKLAIKMLREFENYDGDIDIGWRWQIEAKYREEGTQQDNVLLRHLATIRDAGNANALAGFCAVLTDYIGCCEDGGVPDVRIYENLIERDITGKPGPWPTQDDQPGPMLQ